MKISLVRLFTLFAATCSALNVSDVHKMFGGIEGSATARDLDSVIATYLFGSIYKLESGEMYTVSSTGDTVRVNIHLDEEGARMTGDFRVSSLQEAIDLELSEPLGLTKEEQLTEINDFKSELEKQEHEQKR